MLNMMPDDRADSDQNREAAAGGIKFLFYFSS